MGPHARIGTGIVEERKNNEIGDSRHVGSAAVRYRRVNHRFISARWLWRWWQWQLRTPRTPAANANVGPFGEPDRRSIRIHRNLDLEQHERLELLGQRRLDRDKIHCRH